MSGEAGHKFVAQALERSFISPNVSDRNLEPANLVDVVNRLAMTVQHVADAITPTEVAASSDAAGCLTEAVMGMTGGLFLIASAIERLADAVRDSKV